MEEIKGNATSVEELALAPVDAGCEMTLAINAPTQQTLMRMFRDPRVLEVEERRDLVQSLAAAVEQHPESANLRTVYGMALCVDYKPQTAMEELRTATRLAPDNFLAQLKFGELLMRLRICDQADKHTQAAVKLATNDLQAEMARRQAATIRQMRREGVERNSSPVGFLKVFKHMLGFGGWFANRRSAAITPNMR